MKNGIELLFVLLRKEVVFMARTINGKSIGTVLNELSAPFHDSLIKENMFGYPYLPVEVYRERMDSVVGIMNYDVITSNPQIVFVGTRPQVLLKVTITIKDDEGNIVAKKESPGGVSVIMDSNSKEAVSVKNDTESAAHDAFKRCCKLFGIGERQLKSIRGNQKKGSSKNMEQTMASPKELYRVTVNEKFKPIGKDGYTTMVTTEDGESLKLIIWKEAQEKISEKLSMEKFLQCYIPGKSFRLYGRKKLFSGNNMQQKQLIMDAPFCGEEGK